MIKYLPLLLAIPLGIILAKTTKDEKQIHKKYFKFIIPILILSIILNLILPNTEYRIPNTYALAFTLITTLVWHKF